ncbi:hypothetical protein [Streptomyces sp. NPDC056165]|uniref:hypothetical protein n=1 Tax=Streptomyces sp. NPDC056165 TaxID=3345733 RepID=UPI0035D5A4EA
MRSRPTLTVVTHSLNRGHAPQAHQHLSVRLVGRRHRLTSGVPPKIQIEPEEDLVALLGRFPDRGDAVVMGLFAEHLASSTVLNSTKGNGSQAAANKYGRTIGGGGTRTR